MSADIQQRRALRREYRAKRRALSNEVQESAADAIVRPICRDMWLRSRRVWGLYAASDGELDVTPLMKALHAHKCVVALPVMCGKRLQFAVPGRLKRGRFGIWQPDLAYSKLIPPWRIEVVATPLVAFDDSGHRLGRGGGFYDCTFGTLHRIPFLLGIAHECQQAESLPHSTHDVNLNAVVTPAGLVRF